MTDPDPARDALGGEEDRPPLVTRRAPRELSLGEVPDDVEPKLISVNDGVGDCSLCGSAVRPSGWDAHWFWHHNVEGYGLPKPSR